MCASLPVAGSPDNITFVISLILKNALTGGESAFFSQFNEGHYVYKNLLFPKRCRFFLSAKIIDFWEQKNRICRFQCRYSTTEVSQQSKFVYTYERFRVEGMPAAVLLLALLLATQQSDSAVTSDRLYDESM